MLRTATSARSDALPTGRTAFRSNLTHASGQLSADRRRCAKMFKTPPGSAARLSSMATIIVDIPIAVPADAAWVVIGDWATGPSRMAPGWVTGIRIEGDHRIVTFA